jgi:VanZ family protein
MTTAGKKMSCREWRCWIIVILLIAGTVLLFRGGPDHESARSFKLSWDTGHIIYFALAAWLLSGWRPIARQSLARQWVAILCITLVAGVLIELMQSGAQRSPDINDIVRDMTGSALMLSFGPASALVRSRQRKLFLQITVVIALLLQLWPLAKSLLDEKNARTQFPVLSDFETPFEIDRWRGGAGLAVEQLSVLPGTRVLKVVLSTEQYSGAGLFYLAGDWTQYRSLGISVFNPDEQPLWVTIRAHDRQHTLGDYAYEDRFNRRVLLGQGWNHVEFDLNEVASAPAQRKMDLSQMRGLGIFATALGEPRVIYLDNVRLQ